MSWVSASNGVIPSLAYKGGHDIGQQKIYVARAKYEGGLIPGKLVQGFSCVAIGFNGKEIGIADYQVLLESDEFSWVAVEGKNVPANAVPGGHDPNGDGYYIGRAEHEGSLTTGKVHKAHGCLYIPFGGQEHAHSMYEVLVSTTGHAPIQDQGSSGKSTSGSATPNPPKSKDWRDAGLERHNELRRRHGAPPMTLDPAINSMAQRTAEYLANNRMMQHVSQQMFGHSYGENLAMTSANHSPESATIDAIDRWYNEVQHYNYNSPGFTMHTGHFTQVVWKKSTRLGLGYARNGNYTIVVGQYDPPGNFMNEFRQNVTPN